MARSSAVAGFGLYLDMSVFREERKVPSCRHPEALGKQYCSTCGERVTTRTEYEWSDELDEVNEALDLENLSGALSCIITHEASDDGRFLGWAREAKNYATLRFDPSELPDPEEVWRQIEEILKPWPKLIRREAFGYHVIMTAK